MKFITALEHKLSAVFTEAMRIVDRMRDDGASKEDRETYVADVLREAWPKGRSEPWRYFCEPCGDTGWLYKTCIHGSCGRPFKLPKQKDDDRTGRGQCTEGHSYVEPCACHKGDERRRQLMKEGPSSEDAMAVAARVTKPTRVGR